MIPAPTQLSTSATILVGGYIVARGASVIDHQDGTLSINACLYRTDELQVLGDRIKLPGGAEVLL